ncbi:MAG: 2-amino-4-hydroxy-6-hydroxymethyldihydropteridine diphosphokinase [Acinetobacter sp.]
MNATETIFALALASNCNPELHFKQAFAQIAEIGQVQFSEIYLIPCRDAVGADYWNAACLLKAAISVDDIIALLKKMEADSGRVRPSHQISLDVDLIAWGIDLQHMQFNPKKLPLALDVKIPMLDIWQSAEFQHEEHQFPVVNWMK